MYTIGKLILTVFPFLFIFFGLKIKNKPFTIIGSIASIFVLIAYEPITTIMFLMIISSVIYTYWGWKNYNEKATKIGLALLIFSLVVGLFLVSKIYAFRYGKF